MSYELVRAQNLCIASSLLDVPDDKLVVKTSTDHILIVIAEKKTSNRCIMENPVLSYNSLCLVVPKGNALHIISDRHERVSSLRDGNGRHFVTIALEAGLFCSCLNIDNMNISILVTEQKLCVVVRALDRCWDKLERNLARADQVDENDDFLRCLIGDVADIVLSLRSYQTDWRAKACATIVLYYRSCCSTHQRQSSFSIDHVHERLVCCCA
eukprot:TRINITY_DN1508_c0_g1_i2.p1 TRINITY_DN1508_c0_g1~~TRINITY_DN1508_c0_g1_i2.p1  ORF type:complete len:212 (+),score=14.13 TRINITY_DN1508_c0_g1_i2:158-793(+)